VDDQLGQLLHAGVGEELRTIASRTCSKASATK
jgi:hypothetical protein